MVKIGNETMNKIITYWFKDNDAVKEKPIKSISDQNGAVSFYPNGNVCLTLSRKNGKLHGEYREFYTNGQLKQSANYNNGNLDGQLLQFTEDGIIYKDTYFQNGRCID